MLLADAHIGWLVGQCIDEFTVDHAWFNCCSVKCHVQVCCWQLDSFSMKRSGEPCATTSAEHSSEQAVLLCHVLVLGSWVPLLVCWVVACISAPRSWQQPTC